MKKILWALVGIALITALILLVKKDNPPVSTEGESTNTADMSLLTAHDWVWEQTVFEDGSTMKPNKPSAFTIHFGGDGMVSGTTDCNSWSSSYTIGADWTIRFAPLMSTLMFCTDSQETPYLSGIEGADMFRIESQGNLALLVQVDGVGTIATMTFGTASPAVIGGDWKTKIENGMTFRYPADFGTKYISLTDWPPVLTRTSTAYVCIQSGSEVEHAGITAEIVVNGHTYCETKVSDGAAGSTYTQYAYARGAGNSTEILTFTLRLVQCGNYNAPEMNTCQAERDAFNPTTIVDQMFLTLH